MTSSFPENGKSMHSRQRECGFATEHAEAFALGALDHPDHSRVEQHLSWCGPCRRAVAQARRVTDLLPLLAEPATPSPSVKTALLDRIASVPTGGPPPLPNPWPRVMPPAAAKRASRPTASWRRWLPSVVIAPLAIALLVLAAWTNSLRNEMDGLRAEQREGIEIVAGNGMQLYAMRSDCPTCNRAASGRFGGDPNGSVAFVIAWNLDPTAQHQIWCIDRNGEKWLITTLDVEPTGNVVQMINFPQPLGGYEQIYVARHNGTEDPDAELMVAMDNPQPEDVPTSEVAVPADT